jgi:hypothetical protein
MTVSVANTLYRPSGLSELGRLVLAFIDGGRQWVDWAMADPQARYTFADEVALVVGVQTGLHGTPFVLLPRTGVVVSPAKLMATGMADLRVLAQAEATTGTPPTPSDLAAVLATNGLVTAAQFAEGTAFLARLGLGDSPAFQLPTLEDRLAVRTLALDVEATPPPAGLLAEAAAFGAVQGHPPLEFVDYTRAYLAFATRTGAPTTAAARAAAMQGALDTLLPLSFAALDCPSVPGLVAPWEVRAAIAEWLMMGRQVGFARASLAVQQIVAHAGYAGQTGLSAQQLVREYRSRAQALLSDPDLGRGRLGQDGASCRFDVASPTDAATIELGATGIITLVRLARVPPPATAYPNPEEPYR